MIEATVLPLPPMAPEEIGKLAERIVRGEIFTDCHIHPNDRESMTLSVFMVLALGGLEGVDPEDIGMLWEENSKAAPRSVNGYPCFFSVHLVNREDAAKVWTKVHAMDAALKAAKEG